MLHVIPIFVQPVFRYSRMCNSLGLPANKKTCCLSQGFSFSHDHYVPSDIMIHHRYLPTEFCSKSLEAEKDSGDE